MPDPARAGRMVIGVLLGGLTAVGVRAEPVPRFDPTNWDGATVTNESLKGTRTVLAFTYAKCVLACPLVTRRLRELDEDLGSPADVRFVHVSVNPTEDTPAEILAHFAKHDIDPKLDRRWLFLGGDPEAVSAVLRRFGIEVTRRPVEGGDLIEHTIAVVVVDPAGEVAATFDTYHWDRKEMRDALGP